MHACTFVNERLDVSAESKVRSGSIMDACVDSPPCAVPCQFGRCRRLYSAQLGSRVVVREVVADRFRPRGASTHFVFPAAFRADRRQRHSDRTFRMIGWVHVDIVTSRWKLVPATCWS